MYVGRSRDTIRDELLALWSTQYAALTPPQRLLTAPGSDAYLWASALAVMLEGLEAQAEANALNILPDRADEEALARHAEVDGVPRRPGTVARHSVTVANASDGTKAIPTGTQMVYSDGTRYSIDDASVAISGGTGTVTAIAVGPGSGGTRQTGDVLTFVTSVTGLDPTGTVAAMPTRVAGTDEESLADWAQRIISFRQERPGSGNRSQWREWVESYQGTRIARAFVYPLLEPPSSPPGYGTPDTPGCVTVVAIGPNPTDEDGATNTRLVPADDGSTRTSGAELVRIEDYINGERDITGNTVPDGVQLRPTSLPAGNFSIEAMSTTAENVVMQIETRDPFPWTGSHVITAATSTTIEVAGDQTALNGKGALVLVDATGTSTTPGGYEAYTLPTGVYVGGGTNRTTWTFSEPFPDTPSGTIYPEPPGYATLRAAVLSYFYSLGPGDTDPPSRWPPESSEARATLYRSALAAAVLNSIPRVSHNELAYTPTGVLSAVVTTPGGDVTPPQKTVVVLRTLLFVEA